MGRFFKILLLITIAGLLFLDAGTSLCHACRNGAGAESTGSPSLGSDSGPGDECSPYPCGALDILNLPCLPFDRITAGERRPGTNASLVSQRSRDTGSQGKREREAAYGFTTSSAELIQGGICEELPAHGSCIDSSSPGARSPPLR
ncbi:MAG: hypothetical protein RDV48_27835 [Candidatus Eremiobacteraeota bacterium]|nr:hypothetical protein [Candidatus Eremiobacteraeota bacterium]